MAREAATVAPPTILIQLARQFAAAEAEVEAATQKLKDLKARSLTIEKKFVDEMVTQQMKSFKTDDLGGFRTQAVVYPNVKDKEKFTAFMEKNKKKYAFLLSTNVHGGKLKSYVKELMEQGKPIPPGIEPYMATEIRRF